MAENKSSESTSSKPHPALEQLNAFVGSWQTEGKIKATDANPALSIEGTDTYRWLPGRYFLIHRVDVRMGGEQIDSIEIIGYDPSTQQYPMNYFGHQGNTGVMYASVEGNTWKFTGETERFTGSFNKPRTIMTGTWERLDGADWIDWMDIKLTKLNP